MKSILAVRGCYSQQLHGLLRKRGIALIALYCGNNQRRHYEGARTLHRYSCIGIMEEATSCRSQFRRVLVPCEHLISVYFGFCYTPCFWVARRVCL